MKILYISHHREQSGWGEAARNYILALDSVGVDVVIRPMVLGKYTEDVPTRIIELEQKDIRGCDIAIQHVLPKFMVHDASIYNIGLYVTENDLLYTQWPGKLNCMDELWVPNEGMKTKHDSANIFPDTYVMPHTFDISRYEKIYPKLELNAGGDYIFYTIAEFNTRKNLEATIRAFHSEFSPNEPVSLVIKTSVPGKSAEEGKEIVQNYVKIVKEKMKMYSSIDSYKEEIIICGHMPEEDIMGLHSTGDCFVSTSHAEAWNMGAFDAMAMGNHILLSECDGHNMFNYIPIGCKKDNTYGMMDTFQDMGTSRECWSEVSIRDLSLSMRYSYEGKMENQNFLKIRDKFSYMSVGNLMKNRLEEIYDASN